VALLDGRVMPQQYVHERIVRHDVQDLLRKIVIRPDPEFSAAFPDGMPCRLTVHRVDGTTFHKEKREYPGFFTSPLPWDGVVEKFERLTETHLEPALRTEILQSVLDMDHLSIREFMEPLEKARIKWPTAPSLLSR
jgi:2-methylcitrate dehydratase